MLIVFSFISCTLAKRLFFNNFKQREQEDAEIEQREELRFRVLDLHSF
jgi:hypothetical protein